MVHRQLCRKATAHRIIQLLALMRSVGAAALDGLAAADALLQAADVVAGRDADAAVHVRRAVVHLQQEGVALGTRQRLHIGNLLAMLSY